MQKEGDCSPLDVLSVCVLTISDTRKQKDDQSGKKICEMLAADGHSVFDYQLCTDEPDEIRHRLEQWFAEPSIHAVITTGGTGIAARDLTIETVQPYFTKTLDGFGELFRFVSYTEDVGSKALLSRAAAGTVKEQVLFALPGSSKAVALAMKKLILPELEHIIYELTKHRYT